MFRNNQKEDNTMTPNNFGKKITTLRKQKGLTQARLAEKINVSNKTISRWETGEGYPEISLLKPLARALDTTVDDLLSDDEISDTQTEPKKDMQEHRAFINLSVESKYEHVLINVKALKKLQIYDFWKSLLIFNKISFICLITCGLLLFVGIVTELLMYFGILELYSYNITFAFYSLFICNIGLFSSILGLILDLLGYYKKQTKGSIVFAAVCFAGRFVFPWISMYIPFLFAS